MKCLPFPLNEWGEKLPFDTSKAMCWGPPLVYIYFIKLEKSLSHSCFDMVYVHIYHIKCFSVFLFISVAVAHCPCRCCNFHNFCSCSYRYQFRFWIHIIFLEQSEQTVPFSSSEAMSILYYIQLEKSLTHWLNNWHKCFWLFPDSWKPEVRHTGRPGHVTTGKIPTLHFPPCPSLGVQVRIPPKNSIGGGGCPIIYKFS